MATIMSLQGPTVRYLPSPRLSGPTLLGPNLLGALPSLSDFTSMAAVLSMILGAGATVVALRFAKKRGKIPKWTGLGRANHNRRR
jgi:hypothetical protein